MNKKINYALVLLTLFGLVGCSGGNSSSATPGSTSGQPGKTKGNLEDGLYTNYVDAKSKVATVEDPREDAYEAFTPEGVSIGQFKTIADGMNAAVDYDVEYNSLLPSEEAVYGSYVTKIGGTRVLFKNKAGFSEDNNDQFYYFENGNALAGYNCWDAANSILLLHNSNLITHQISGFGTVSRQSWNSYTLLDSYGELVDDVTAQSWELSSTMDGAVISFPHRLGGVTKLNYELDLSDVKIAPPYDTCYPTYAFIGFYAWQDYYVIAIGIACDTSTGNWYQFIGTSRDDSFSDVEYNIGECLLTSTYNESAGYFVPDASSLSMSIETKEEYDAEWDENYQVDYLKFEFDNGSKFERNITDSLINNYFPGYPLGFENSYAFIAGLDIKNETVASQFVENVDYFNGSFFTGLKVVDAQGYVPTVEEMSDVKYGYSIEPEWRGKWHDLLMANDKDTPEVMDYTIMNTALCAEYIAANQVDTYSFGYTGNPVSALDLGIEATEYQSKIDRLGEMTIEDLLKDPSLYNEVGEWLVDGQTIVPQRIFLILDFTGYYHAKELIEQHSISEDARKVIEAFKALDAKDYEGFGLIYETDYAALTEDEKKTVKLSIGTAEFENREGLYLYVKNLPTDREANVLFEKYIYVNESGVCSGFTSMTTKEAFDDFLNILSLVSAGTQWRGELGSYNDDPNNAKVKVMNGDNNFWPSMRIVDHYLYFTETLGLDLPNFIHTMLGIAEFDDFYTGFYLPIYGVTEIALRINKESLTTTGQLTGDELAFLNEYWTCDYVISDHLSWNWISGNKFETYFSTRTRGVTVCAGGDGVVLTRDYFEVVANFLEANGYTVKSSGWGVEEAVII